MDAIKKRNFVITGMSCGHCEQTIEEILSAIDGVTEVNANSGSGVVNIEYDLGKTNFQAVENAIEESSYKLSKKFSEKQKRQGIHFTEQQEFNKMNQYEKNCGGYSFNFYCGEQDRKLTNQIDKVMEKLN